MLKKLLLLVCLGLSAFAYTLEYIKSGPKSFARDFVIERYLEQNITAEQAYEVYSLLKSPKRSHKQLLLERTGDKETSAGFECEKLENLELNSSCILKNISLSRLTKKLMDGNLTRIQVAKFAEKIKNEDEKLFAVLSAIASTSPTAYLANSPQAYTKLFFDSHKSYRRAFLNVALESKTIESLAKQGEFARFIKFALFDKELANVLGSFIGRQIQTNDAEALFYLGLVSLKVADKDGAISCFDRSLVSAKSETTKDRARFWLYLVSKNEEYLKKIVSHNALNFYAVSASEILDTDFPPYKTLAFKNTKKSPIDTKDPFEWLNIQNSLSKMSQKSLDSLAKRYSSKGLEPFYLRILETKGEAGAQTFLLNYTEYMKDATVDEKAMYLAIARQESAFLPTDTSSAYALGVMQIIPLLAQELDERYKNRKKLSELFDPKINVPLAIKHFKSLRAKYGNIVYISMCFNAGEGFFKRVSDEGLFSFEDEKTNQYEPFWSIENIPYNETRNYAKKVSTNYIVYKKILGERATLVKTLQNLKPPRQTLRVSSLE